MKFVALTTAFALASLVVAEHDANFGGTDLSSGTRNLSSRVNYRRSLKKGKKKKSSEPIEEPEEVQPEPEVLEPEVVEPEIVEPEVVEPEVVEPEIVEPEVVEPNAPTCDEVKDELAELLMKLDASNDGSRSTISLFFNGYLRYLEESGATINDQELYDVLLIESALDPSFVSVDVGVPMPEVREECALICEDFLDSIGELMDAEQDNVNIVMYFLGSNYVV